MTLGAFTDASYALMVRSFQGIPGKTLFDAIEFVEASLGIENSETKEVAVEESNEASLRQLEAMMRGV